MVKTQKVFTRVEEAGMVADRVTCGKGREGRCGAGRRFGVLGNLGTGGGGAEVGAEGLEEWGEILVAWMGDCGARVGGRMVVSGLEEWLLALRRLREILVRHELMLKMTRGMLGK